MLRRCAVFCSPCATLRTILPDVCAVVRSCAQLCAVERRDVRSGAQLSAGMCAVVRRGALHNTKVRAVYDECVRSFFHSLLSCVRRDVRRRAQ